MVGYVCIDNDAALGHGLEEVLFGKPTVIIQVKKLEGLEEEGVSADLGGSLELYFINEFRFESMWGMLYAAMDSFMLLNLL